MFSGWVSRAPELLVVLFLAGAVLHAWPTLFGTYLPIGRYRRAAPPSVRRRVQHGVVAIIAVMLAMWFRKYSA